MKYLPFIFIAVLILCMLELANIIDGQQKEITELKATRLDYQVKVKAGAYEMYQNGKKVGSCNWLGLSSLILSDNQ